MTSMTITFGGWRKRPLRTVLSGLSVMIAVGVLTVTLTTTRRINEALDAAYAPKVIVTNLLEGRPLPLAYLERIKSVPGVIDMSYARDLMGDDRKKAHFHIQAVADRHPEVAVKAMWSVSTDDAARWHADKTGVLASATTLEQFGWKIGDTVSIHSNIGELQGKLDGIVSGYGVGKLYVVVHYDYVNELLKPEERGRVGGFTVLLEDYGKLNTVSNSIDDQFAATADSTLTAPLDQYVSERLKKISAIPELLIKIGILIILVTVFISASTLGMSLVERRRELAVLRAIGYSRRRIFLMVLGESMFLCTVAGAVGSGILWLLFRNEGLHMADVGVLSNMTIGLDSVGISVAMSLALGVVVAIVPILSTLRLDVAKVLAE